MNEKKEEKRRNSIIYKLAEFFYSAVIMFLSPILNIKVAVALEFCKIASSSRQTSGQLRRVATILFALFLFLLFIGIVFAIPQTFNIHGKLTDSSNVPLSGNYNLTFRIYDSYASGSLLWNGTNQTVTTDSNGVYSVILKNIDLNFSDQFFLSVEVASDGEMSPRINLTSAPYAFRAQNITIAGVEFNNNVDIGAHNFTVDSGVLFVDSTGNNVGIGTTSPGEKLHVFVDDDSTSLGMGRIGNVEIENDNTGDYTFAALALRSDTFDTAITAINDGSSNGGRLSFHVDKGAGDVGESLSIVSGTGNVGIGTTNPNYLLTTKDTGTTTAVNLSDVLFVDASNNRVGIGTASPTSLLTVQSGSYQADISPSASGVNITSTGANMDIKTTDANSLRFYTNNVERARFLSTGQFGIGTITPKTLLHISDSISPNITLSSTTADSANSGHIEFKENDGVSGAYLHYDGSANRFDIGSIVSSVPYDRITVMRDTGNVGIGTATPQYMLQIAQGNKALNVSNLLFVNSSHVGIGTKAPNQLLEVSSAAGNSVAQISSEASGMNASLNLYEKSTYYYGAQLFYDGGTNKFNILTGNTNAGFTNRLSIDRDTGNVGIGTGSPDAPLHLSDGTRHLRFKEVATFSYELESSGDITYDVAANSRHIFVVGATEIMRMDGSNGNVGIGTTSPAHKLEVAGSMNVTNLNVSGDLRVSGTSYLGSITINANKVTTAELDVTDNATIGNVTIMDNSLYQPVYGSDDGLVLYLPFNDGTTQYDRSPYGIDGTLAGGTICNSTNGKYGSGCYFDGVDDMISAGVVADNDGLFNNGGTVEGWINPKSDGEGDIGLVTAHWSGGWLIRVREESSGAVKLSFSRDGSTDGDWRTTNRVIPTNQWTYFAVVYNDGDNTDLAADPIIYINGVSESITEAATPVGMATDSGGTTYVGSFSGTQAFDGTIDEIKYYKRVLSPDEIRTHYLRGNGYGASGAITADKFRLVNTSGTKIFEINQTSVKIAPGGVDRLTIVSSGNVGIGTANPNYLLTTKDTGTTTAVNLSDVLFVDAQNNRVGIGNTLPNRTFHVSGTSQFDGAMNTSGYWNMYGSNDNYGMIIRAASSNTHYASIGASDTYATFTFDGTIGTGISVIAGGNVGIGTTNPGYLLTTKDTGTTTAVNLSGVLFVDAQNNRVGIGNTLPNRTFHVSGISQFDGAMNTSNYWNMYGSNDNYGMLIRAASSNTHYASIGASSTYATFTFDGTIGTGISVIAGGNVGIGDTTPETRLDVDGGNVSFDNGVFYFDSTNDRVGIGTVSPATKVEVNLAGASQTGAVTLLSGGSGNYLSYSIGREAIESNWAVSAGANHFAQGSVAGDVILRSEGGKLLFDTNAGSGVPSLTILGANGNVGIGTTNPINGKLEISDATSAKIALTKTGAGAETSSIFDDGNLNINSPTQLWLGTTGGVTLVGAANNLVVQGTGISSIAGNVGIGTTSPGKQLVVNGTTQGITFDPDVPSPVINTTTSASNSNLTITSSAGSVIIRLG